MALSFFQIFSFGPPDPGPDQPKDGLPAPQGMPGVLCPWLPSTVLLFLKKEGRHSLGGQKHPVFVDLLAILRFNQFVFLVHVAFLGVL